LTDTHASVVALVILRLSIYPSVYLILSMVGSLLMNDPAAFVKQYDTDGSEAGKVNWREEYERVLEGHRAVMDRSRSAIMHVESAGVCAIASPER
jgi:hypothetical protein